MLPMALFGVSIATAVFPTMAQQAATDSIDHLQSTLYSSLRYILFLIIPASVGLILLREPLVSLLLQRGEFTADATTSLLGASLLLHWLFAHSAWDPERLLALRDTARRWPWPCFRWA
jgi:putative peptidoglycan lipid II flippase